MLTTASILTFDQFGASGWVVLKLAFGFPGGHGRFEINAQSNSVFPSRLQDRLSHILCDIPLYVLDYGTGVTLGPRKLSDINFFVLKINFNWEKTCFKKLNNSRKLYSLKIVKFSWGQRRWHYLSICHYLGPCYYFEAVQYIADIQYIEDI